MIVHLAVGQCSYEARLLEGNLWNKCCMKINHHRFPLMRLQWSLNFQKIKPGKFIFSSNHPDRQKQQNRYLQKNSNESRIVTEKGIIKPTAWKRGKTGGARLESFHFWLVEKKTWHFFGQSIITNWQSLSCNRYWGRSGPQFKDASAKRETSERKEKRKTLIFFNFRSKDQRYN